MTKAKTNTCPACGGRMVWESRDDFAEYQGQRRVFQSTGWWCTKCGEGVLEGDELSKGFREHAVLRAEVDGVLSPDEVRRARERLGLSQRRASAVLGGGPNAFQHYESGKTPPSVAMSHLLRLLGRHPELLHELALKEGKAAVRIKRRAGTVMGKVRSTPSRAKHGGARGSSRLDDGT